MKREAMLALMLTCSMLLASDGQRSPEPEFVEPPMEVYRTIAEPTGHWTDYPMPPVPEQKIYFDTALSHEMQDFIADVCEGYHIAPALIIAMIERESKCDADAVGDSGASVGLMQIQERWHQERMERLGVTDLTDPKQNVTVGIDFVYELSQKNQDIYWVLHCYNGGKAYADRLYDAWIISDYAEWVVERSAELEKIYE